ncbi:Platinum sensitivity protein [Talaromyces marneffei ATCC 18224]|uniref:DUF625 domain protein, putative n=1 Tax=Talaromyces marneffei (strain ATCC 18224 / CBS 334.59 / QM 7333) TaxID=441960 RepID=B6Q2D1_TALMQ|nr:uncharacterized protein EYB26_002257 [Talaromyces marneffei]EEA29002.1 DUF625 domain protein, putative [Talaromyces marneffei ATCC 18224]QGA14601.1 hypothetical protein EYB26_002257 [Talaromyces marneffei]
MALAIKLPQDRKRVKVYELRDNDWFDRGTGFCTGAIVEDMPRIYVESEDEKGRCLLNTTIGKEEGYQKQQDTLIVWTETNGTDMALSFQEADGCAAIWEYVSSVRDHLIALAGDDALSDEAIEAYHQPIMLPPPTLGNLPDIEAAVRAASLSQVGRDALGKFVLSENYIDKLIPLVSDAEDMESLPDLHRLCNIMKSLILLNDNIIIEHVVTDPIIIGVVGALEYDPDFPTHKANHRQYLQDQSRYREVVPMKDPVIQKKIRQTWRLQYLKDVVLARILDDPTFSVLNSLIFFNQVDIINHIQTNAAFLKELFAIFDPRNTDQRRKDDAVCFIHQCASIAKNLQAPARATLFSQFIGHGLFPVIAFAVKHPKPPMRTTGIDILVALLDHDPIMMRGYMLKAINEKKTPLTDTLIDLLHTEQDLGVKNQLADAIKVLLDPQITIHDPMNRAGGDLSGKARSAHQLPDAFVQIHFDESAKRLFTPLKQLEGRASVADLTFQEVTLYAHLVDILTFFVRQHLFRSRNFIHSDNLTPRVAQLLTVPQKHLKLTALKFFRTLVSLQDTFYLAQLTHNNTFGLILDIVHETMPRDNLLNSACLELFEFIKRDNIKPIITHVVEKYREKLKAITYVDIFEKLIQRYDELQGYGFEADATLFSQEEIPPSQRGVLNGQRWQGVREPDAAEEEYFNASDDEEEWPSDTRQEGLAIVNQTASHVRLVDYPDDDDDEVMDAKSETIVAGKQEIELPERGLVDTTTSPTTPSSSQHPPERLSEKRRRDEDDEDELGRLAQNGSKRRSSSASSTASMYFLRRQNSVDRNLKNSVNNDTSTANATPKKIAINLSSALKSHVTVEAEAIQLSEFDEQATNGEEHKETNANEGETETQSS